MKQDTWSQQKETKAPKKPSKCLRQSALLSRGFGSNLRPFKKSPMNGTNRNCKTVPCPLLFQAVRIFRNISQVAAGRQTGRYEYKEAGKGP